MAGNTAVGNAESVRPQISRSTRKDMSECNFEMWPVL